MRTRDTNKEELVKQKAIEMLVKQGIEGFGMNRLAKECGVSVATLYIYYTDKEDLIKKIGVEIGQNFFNEMIKDFSPDMTFREGLHKQWENRARFVIHHPLKVACWELLCHSTHREYIMEKSMSDFKFIMGDFAKNAIERKELISTSKEVFWSIAYGPLYTLLRFHNEGKSLGGTPFKLTKKATEDAFELVIKALTP
ncbi:TetR/AcrR family transcriptional regulator [Flavobacterium gilvum]|uniref:TetR family transcriptional regulator n=1 Tax=Flavobacterium gilvum TaxID=1492737 RepID=A0AAC9I694_9FLAO|nr:TetR/AcrR family transcriptional regulator [Flavobacterium gilvum]AOW09678.1 TetR family transcriptional regulator [Flavobacterium gilvum]KFC60791.1 TetR family transcriptional regulator [Flavobacterium gilvum]